MGGPHLLNNKQSKDFGKKVRNRREQGSCFKGGPGNPAERMLVCFTLFRVSSLQRRNRRRNRSCKSKWNDSANATGFRSDQRKPGNTIRTIRKEERLIHNECAGSIEINCIAVNGTITEKTKIRKQGADNSCRNPTERRNEEKRPQSDYIISCAKCQ